MAECLTPFYRKVDHEKYHEPVPCGKCPACTARRISGWSFRLRQEEKKSVSSHFITLTYDTQHVPITERGFMVLRKKELQDFFKRLRKNHPPRSVALKYYAIGEYGGETDRPHYHIILFNAKLELIQPSWPLGQVHYGNVEPASIGYCLQYISKPSRIPYNESDDRAPEFRIMSKGLGLGYLTPKMVKWHLADVGNRMYCPMEEGKKIAMPRYYKDKIYDEDQRALANQVTRSKMLIEQVREMQLLGIDHWQLKDIKEAGKMAIFKSAHFKNKISKHVKV